MADPTASIWEVTRLILSAPESSPSEIADAHGFSSAEVAELLPIFFDNLRADYSQATGGAPPGPPEPRPDESVDDHAARYLGELSENLGGHIDVVSFESFGTFFLDPAGPDPDFETSHPGFDDLPVTSGPEQLGTPDETGAEESWGAFGSGEPGGPAAAAQTPELTPSESDAGPRFDTGEGPDAPDQLPTVDDDDLPDSTVDPEPEDLSGSAFQFD